MKKIFVCVLTVAIMLTSFSALAITPVNNSVPETFSEEKVLEARFLNMLNHSFTYGEDLSSVEKIVNSSMPALLSMRENEDDSYIKEEYVRKYVFDMFGVEIESFEEINVNFPKKEGYVFILPRGFEVYNHTIESVTKNEDGSYTVITTAFIDSFDGVLTEKLSTLFVENKDSEFGFKIISSNYIDTSLPL